jgi:hypothetical protein
LLVHVKTTISKKMKTQLSLFWKAMAESTAR